MSRTSVTSSTKPGRRALLTREIVVRAALEMIDRGPLDAFSMRALADELGVGAMTLYGYVRSREDLLAAATAIAFGAANDNPPDGARWDEQLIATVSELHDICLSHPNLVALVLAQSNPNPGLFRLREGILSTLRDAGFDQLTALHALGVLCSYAIGFATAQAANVPLDLPERIHELPPAEFPHLTAAADIYADHLSATAFAAGLDLLIAGLRTQLKTQP